MLTIEREIESTTTPTTPKNRHRLLSVAVASGLAAASLNLAAPAHAWCIGLSGINIGSGCTSTFGNFAIGLGPNAEASSDGFITGAIAVGDSFASSKGAFTAAWAGGSGAGAFAEGELNWAVAQGTNVAAVAGQSLADFASVAINFGNADESWDSDELGTSIVEASYGGVNLAANLFGNANTGADLRVISGGSETTNGYGNASINMIGSNRNDIETFGSLNLAINVGNVFTYPNGSDTTILVGDYLNNDPATLSIGFAVQPPFITPECPTDCGNIVRVHNGLLSLAGALGLVNEEVDQDYLGINIRTPWNGPATNSTLTRTRTVEPATTMAFNSSTTEGSENQPTESSSNTEEKAAKKSWLRNRGPKAGQATSSRSEQSEKQAGESSSNTGDKAEKKAGPRHRAQKQAQED